MHLKRVFLYAAIIALLTTMIGCGLSRIQIREVANNYELTVHQSRLVMNLPKGGFVRAEMNMGGGTSNPRYFYFQDNRRQIILSGWFEPAERFPGIKKYWEDHIDALRRKIDTLSRMGQTELLKPQDVFFVNVGKWDAILYDVKYPPYIQAHISANWLQRETWIELHLSGISSLASSKEVREMLVDVLKGISFSEKKEW
jgi:hypothetical protein